MFLDVRAGIGERDSFSSSELLFSDFSSSKFLPTQSVEIDQETFPIARIFDILFAIAAIVASAPLLLLIACILKIGNEGPAIFVHRRIGRFGLMFPCLKFRTMVVDADQVLRDHLAASPEARAEWDRDFKLQKDPRVTRIGRLLRKSSFDELPQLFNILAGHMSVVGPRPIVAAEIPRYGAHFPVYCAVRPGLTGPWQISGRSNMSYDERVWLDSHYARNKSLIGDLGIVVRTVPAVLFAKGAC